MLRRQIQAKRDGDRMYERNYGSSDMNLERSSFTNRLLCVNVEGDLKVFCVSEFDFRGGWGETGATYIWARFFYFELTGL